MYRTTLYLNDVLSCTHESFCNISSTLTCRFINLLHRVTVPEHIHAHVQCMSTYKEPVNPVKNHSEFISKAHWRRQGGFQGFLETPFAA